MQLTHPAYWLYLPTTIATVCFLIAVGSPNRFIDYAWLWLLFRATSPYFWSAYGVAFAVGMSILGAAWWVAPCMHAWRMAHAPCLPHGGCMEGGSGQQRGAWGLHGMWARMILLLRGCPLPHHMLPPPCMQGHILHGE
jgi:hypothetical protein